VIDLDLDPLRVSSQWWKDPALRRLQSGFTPTQSAIVFLDPLKSVQI